MALLENRKARYDYEILETYQAGLILHGWEVKSIRGGQGSLKGAWVSFHEGRLWVKKMQVVPYKYAQGEMEVFRERQLLLKKKEYARLERQLSERGRTLVPLSVYNKNGVLKMDVALVQGKKKHEKRAKIKERVLDRAAKRAIKDFSR